MQLTTNLWKTNNQLDIDGHMGCWLAGIFQLLHYLNNNNKNNKIKLIIVYKFTDFYDFLPEFSLGPF